MQVLDLCLPFVQEGEVRIEDLHRHSLPSPIPTIHTMDLRLWSRQRSDSVADNPCAPRPPVVP
eukprot:scaffold39625_cov168-Amphora_coffeaeformis.AAC.2